MSKDYMQNRELSWLKFNERVLNKAEKTYMPPFEKLNFIKIFTTNLDEFFMIRVGSLADLQNMKKDVVDARTGMNVKEQLDAVMASLPAIYAGKDKLYKKVMQELRAYGIIKLEIKNLDELEKKYAEDYFKNMVQPLLSPLVVNKSHPFPFLSNLRKYVFFDLNASKAGKNIVGIIPIADELNQIVVFPSHGEIKFLFVDELIEHYGAEVFRGYTVSSYCTVSVTRNFDYVDRDYIKDEFDDYKKYMKEIIKQRQRLKAVRIETNRPLSQSIEKILLKELDIEKNRIFTFSSPMDMSFVNRIKDKLDRETLERITYKKFNQYNPYPPETTKSYFSLIEKKDVLLAYPYEDINVFLNLIKEASNNRNVIAIKITIYRLAKNSKLVQHLCNAAENGIDVTVCMELKARFDEENNINYSEILYDAGCNIIYGFEEYKIHSKICMISYKKNDEIKYITQIGTGNYNEITSRLYTDFSFITSNMEIGKDALNFFNNMNMGIANGNYTHLLQSPSTFKSTISDLIDEQIAKGSKGRLLFKMNSFTDIDLIQKLSAASNAGVDIKMIIRGICCIKPGVKDYTENVRVVSIVGRFLEHSRVYIFGEGDEMKIYISSADLMTRNTQKRIEIACPIYDKEIKAKLETYLLTQLADNIDAKYIDQNGDYQPIQSDKEPLSMQETYMLRANEKSALQKDYKKTLRQQEEQKIAQKNQEKLLKEEELANSKERKQPAKNSQNYEQIQEQTNTQTEKDEQKKTLIEKIKDLFR